MRTPAPRPRLMGEATQPGAGSIGAARRTTSKLARCAATSPTPSSSLEEKEAKRRWQHIRLGLPPIIDAPHGPSSQPRSLIRRSVSYRGRHDNHAWCGNFETTMHRQRENSATKRDSGPSYGETRTRTGDTTIFSRAVGDGWTHAIPGNQAVLRRPELQVEVAIYELLHAVQEMEASHLLFADALSGVAAGVSMEELS
jgi:hypothetical protein